MSGTVEIQLPNGEVRRLGNNPPPHPLLMAGFPVYGDTPAAPMVPRSQWDGLLAALDDTFDDPFLPPVADQNGRGQCNAEATVAMLERQRAVQGLPFVKLSAADLYGRINGGVDNGSTLPDAMREATARGVGTAATAGLLWHPGSPPAPAAERARYRALEVFLCPTFDHAMSAMFEGFGLVSGIKWANSYMRPGPDGWLPAPDSWVGGHAIMGYKPAFRDANKSGSVKQYGGWHQNSWTTVYAVGGRMVLAEFCYGNQIGGIWAAREVVDEGGVVPGQGGGP
jgi:hypothetical protein